MPSKSFKSKRHEFKIKYQLKHLLLGNLFLRKSKVVLILVTFRSFIPDLLEFSQSKALSERGLYIVHVPYHCSFLSSNPS